MLQKHRWGFPHEITVNAVRENFKNKAETVGQSDSFTGRKKKHLHATVFKKENVEGHCAKKFVPNVTHSDYTAVNSKCCSLYSHIHTHHSQLQILQLLNSVVVVVAVSWLIYLDWDM